MKRTIYTVLIMFVAAVIDAALSSGGIFFIISGVACIVNAIESLKK